MSLKLNDMTHSKIIFALLLNIYISVIFTASASQSNPDWRIVENRNAFDDSLVSLTAVRAAENKSGGWLSLSCQLKPQKFVINIISGEMGFRKSDNSQDTNNFRYKIDDAEAKVITVEQIVDGAITSNNLNLILLKDILKGGKSLTTQHILTGSENSFIERFDLAGAKETVTKITESCEKKTTDQN